MVQQVHHLTASALVIDPNKMLTLLVRHRLTGFWQAPGGHVEQDEAPHETAAREAQEETGVGCTIWSAVTPLIPGAVWLPQPLMVAEFPAPADPEWGEPEHRHVDFLYLAMSDSTRPLTPQIAEVNDARWWPFDELHADSIRPDVPVALNCALDLIQLTLPAGDRR